MAVNGYNVLLDFITDTLIDIGALVQGQTPNNSEAQYIFRQFNQFLDELSAQRAWLFTQTEALLPLSAKQTYQIGPGAADFPQFARPVRIDRAAMLIPGTTLRVRDLRLYNHIEWEDIVERTRTGQGIDGVYCDYAYPIANLNVFPIPTTAPTLSIFFWSVLAQYVTIQDPIGWPPGYQAALMKGLGVRLRSSFHSPMIDQVYIQLAAQTGATLRALNTQLFGNSAMSEVNVPVPGSAQPTVAPQTSPNQPAA